MMDIFNFFGSILGYLLWFFYTLIQNYGIAIILFTVTLKIFMFPFSVKQQKSMAATSKMSLKTKELQKKYGNDKAKLQEETQKLYEKEGVKNVWEANFDQLAIPFTIEDIIEFAQNKGLENIIAVDATASSELVKHYIPLIQNGFNPLEFLRWYFSKDKKININRDPSIYVRRPATPINRIKLN